MLTLHLTLILTLTLILILTLVLTLTLNLSERNAILWPPVNYNLAGQLTHNTHMEIDGAVFGCSLMSTAFWKLNFRRDHDMSGSGSVGSEKNRPVDISCSIAVLVGSLMTKTGTSGVDRNCRQCASIYSIPSHPSMLSCPIPSRPYNQKPHDV